MGAAAEYLQDQPGPIKDLGVPFLFEIALLDRRDSVIDNHEVNGLVSNDVADFADLATAEQRRRTRVGHGDDDAIGNIEFDGVRQAHRFCQPVRWTMERWNGLGFGLASGGQMPWSARTRQYRHEHQGPTDRSRRRLVNKARGDWIKIVVVQVFDDGRVTPGSLQPDPDPSGAPALPA